MKTAAVTIGMGKDFYEMATWTGAHVEKHLGLEVRIIDDSYHHLGVREKNHDFMQKASTVKFSVFDIFPDLDRVVFFDADWRPVRPFDIFSFCPDPEKLYFTLDRQNEATRELEAYYGLERDTYFNAGFFVASRKFKTFFEEGRDNFGTYKEVYFDQCVLNQILKGKVSITDKRLNVQEIKAQNPSALLNNKEVLAFHSGDNFNIMRGWIEDYDWN